jgi:hypothetical protein
MHFAAVLQKFIMHTPGFHFLGPAYTLLGKLARLSCSHASLSFHCAS